MVKLIQSDSPENLEYEINAWIESQETETRNVQILNVIPSMLARPKGPELIQNMPREVLVIWQAWIVYKKVYAPFN